MNTALDPHLTPTSCLPFESHECKSLAWLPLAARCVRAQRDWPRAGRPRHPGRLNEACHMVFKGADQPWRRERPDIAAMIARCQPPYSA